MQWEEELEQSVMSGLLTLSADQIVDINARENQRGNQEWNSNKMATIMQA